MIGQHRQDRGKQLLTHSRTVRGNGAYHRWSDLQGFGIGFAAEQDGFTVQNFGDPVKVPLVDNAAIVGILQGIFPVHLPNGVVKQGQEPILNGILNQQIVRGYTGLPAVEVFTEGNALGGDL